MWVVQISVGRNIGTTPMSDRDWRFFLNDASNVIRHQNERPEFHFGRGVWEGIVEQSVRITVYRDEEPTDTEKAYIRAMLPVIAARYGQDAIGLVISESILVERHR